MKRQRNRTLPLTFEPYAKVVWLNYPDNIEKPYCLEYCGPHWENLLYDFFRNNEEIYQHIHSLETNLGFTAGAIEIHFKYDTPNELIEEICNQAIQMMQVATTPIFEVGQSALFKTTQSDLVQYNNCEVIIKRLLTEDECDIDEVGFMYEVETNGETFQVYQDELSQGGEKMLNTKEKYNEYLDSVDNVCMECALMSEEQCEKCPVRITVKQLEEYFESKKEEQ